MPTASPAKLPWPNLVASFAVSCGSVGTQKDSTWAGTHAPLLNTTCTCNYLPRVAEYDYTIIYEYTYICIRNNHIPPNIPYTRPYSTHRIPPFHFPYISQVHFPKSPHFIYSTPLSHSSLLDLPGWLSLTRPASFYFHCSIDGNESTRRGRRAQLSSFA